MNRPLGAFAFVCGAALTACTASRPVAPPKPSPPAPSAYLVHLNEDARAMAAEVRSPFSRRFLEGVSRLPTHGDDETFYEADTSAPLHFVLPIEVLSSHGFEWRPGVRLLDFGYGSIGHLALLAAAEIDASGIEVKPKLESLYGTGTAPRIHLFHGRYPAEPPLVAKVGGGYDVIVSKNVLKKGYIHPDRPAKPEQLIQLGVDDATFLRAFRDALAPGGRMLVYNIFVPVPLDQPFKPMSDGRSPFPREAWEAAGFDVEAFDEPDTTRMRAIVARADRGTKAYLTYESLFTLVRRSNRLAGFGAEPQPSPR